MRILYISSKRSEERVLLAKIHGLEFEEVSLHLKSTTGTDILRKLLVVFRKVKKFKPDLILLEGAAVFSFIPALIGKAYKVPFLVRVKGDIWKEYAEIEYNTSLFEKMVKLVNFRAGSWILKHSCAILPIADHLRPVISRNVGIEKPLYTVHITIKRLSELSLPKRFNGNRKFVLTVTNFDFWGKVEPLADAINKVAPIAKKNGYSWVVLGNGFFMEEFMKAVKKQIDSGIVDVIGRHDPYPYYQRAQALFYISGMDGLPNVLLEAAYFKLPIIINNNCPAVDFVIAERTGIVVDFNELDDVQVVMNRLVYAYKNLEFLGHNAFTYFNENFSAEKVSEELRIALEDCLAHYNK